MLLEKGWEVSDYYNNLGVWASIAFVPQYKVNSLCLSESLYK